MLWLKIRAQYFAISMALFTVACVLGLLHIVLQQPLILQSHPWLDFFKAEEGIYIGAMISIYAVALIVLIVGAETSKRT